jgi:hypothetical protein
MSRLPTVLAAAMILTTAACDNALEPADWTRRLGLVMDNPPHLTSLVAPDEVTRGVPFQITVTTFGSSSCTLPDGHELTYPDGAAEVKAYDLAAPSQTPCTDDIHSFPRTVTVQFHTVGTAEIRVVGRSFASSSQDIRTITKTVTVE